MPGLPDRCPNCGAGYEEVILADDELNLGNGREDLGKEVIKVCGPRHVDVLKHDVVGYVHRQLGKRRRKHREGPGDVEVSVDGRGTGDTAERVP